MVCYKNTQFLKDKDHFFEDGIDGIKGDDGKSDYLNLMTSDIT